MTHTYNHIGTSRDGFDLFECPLCGRRVALRWPPNYKKIVLVDGELVVHSFAQGGLQMNAIATSQDDDERLRVFDDFLDKLQGHDDPA
jgi:hypothetical protein